MAPRVEGFRWPPGIRDKVYAKHGLERDEVEEAFFYRGSRVCEGSVSGTCCSHGLKRDVTLSSFTPKQVGRPQ